MKSGTGSDPFSDADEEADQHEQTGTDQSSPETDGEDKPDLPYIFERDTVRGDRDQIPFFFREWVQQQEDEFIDTLEADVGEDVPKADAREAAQIFAHRNPEAVADVLREFGYDY